MEALTIVLIVAAIIVAVVLLALCYKCYGSGDDETPVDEPESRKKRAPAYVAPAFQYECENEPPRGKSHTVRRLIASINSETGLKIVGRVRENVTPSDKCRRKHIHRKGFPLDEARAVAISQGRKDTILRNTVFDWPRGYGFHAYETENGEAEVIVSANKVTTFQCTRKDGGWEAEHVGKSYAVFQHNHCLWKQSLNSSDRKRKYGY